MHSVKAHHPESGTLVKPRGLELRTESCDDTLLRSVDPVSQPPPSSAEDAKSESETKCSPLPPPTEGETTTSSVPEVSNNDGVEEETVATSEVETEEATKLQVQSFVDNFNTSLLEDEAGVVNNMILSKWLWSVFYCHEDCHLT